MAPWYLIFSPQDSEQADQLETEKKSARTKAADSRRKKFQAQDSVLNETFNASQVWKYFPFTSDEIFFRKAAMSNDDNPMLQMTALVSVVSIMIIVLFSKSQTSQPPGYLVSGSPADQTQFNAILCCSLFYVIYYLLLLLLD